MNLMKTLLTLGIAMMMLCQTATGFAQRRHWVDVSTDVFMFLPAVAGATVSLCKKDYTGLKQLALSGATSCAANYLLELAIKKNRPDGTGEHAFPSTHVTAAFTGATFLQRRYGWKWGLPAYIVSAYVGWGRIYAKKHDVWDVMAGAVLGAGASLICTRPFAKKGSVALAPAVINFNPGIYFSASF